EVDARCQSATRHAPERLPMGAGYVDTGYVAINEPGEPYTPEALTNMWRRLTASAEVRPIRLHDARHSCGTALHLRGVPLAVIAKWLGHAQSRDHGAHLRALPGRGPRRRQFGRSCDERRCST